MHIEPHVAADGSVDPVLPTAERVWPAGVAGQVPGQGQDEGDPAGELNDVVLVDGVAVLRFAVDPREDDAHQHGKREDEQRRPHRPPVDPGNSALVADLARASLSASP